MYVLLAFAEEGVFPARLYDDQMEPVWDATNEITITDPQYWRFAGHLLKRLRAPEYRAAHTNELDKQIASHFRGTVPRIKHSPGGERIIARLFHPEATWKKGLRETEKSNALKWRFWDWVESKDRES